MTQPASSLPETTKDLFLGGGFALVQERRGAHRCGSDAILLAATVPNGVDGRVVDLGSGPGAAGFAVACRSAAEVVLVDCDEVSLTLAALSLDCPENKGFAERITTCLADVEGPLSAFTDAGLGPEDCERVIANPPFFEPGRHRVAGSEGRARARMLGENGLEPWIRRAAHLLRPTGTLHLVLPTALLPQLLTVASGRFGGIDILPVHARADAAAERMLVVATKGSRAPMRIVPGLVMHDGDGRYSAEANRILTDGAAIDWPSR